MSGFPSFLGKGEGAFRTLQLGDADRTGVTFLRAQLQGIGEGLSHE